MTVQLGVCKPQNACTSSKMPRNGLSPKQIRQRTLAGYMTLPDNPASKGLPAFMVKVANLGATADRNDPLNLLTHFYKYLELCEAYEVPVGNLAAYAAMGVTKEQISRWASGERRDDDPRYKELAMVVRSTCAAYREAMMATNKIAPATGIFWQKNFDGMKDIQDVIVGGNDPLGEKADPAAIIDKYKDIIKPQ